MKTTLNKIREYNPCIDGWRKLLAYLGKTHADDEPLSLLTILDSNGVDNALWCLRVVEGHDKEIRLFAVWCARQVQHLLKDQRSLYAIDTAERYANGEATDDELNDATEAAGAAVEAAERAAWDAADATEAAWAAARASRAARYAAKATAWDARDAARAARYATEAARAARYATWDAAWAAAADTAEAARYAAKAARDVAKAKQEAELRRICGEIELCKQH